MAPNLGSTKDTVLSRTVNDNTRSFQTTPIVFEHCGMDREPAGSIKIMQNA